MSVKTKHAQAGFACSFKRNVCSGSAHRYFGWSVPGNGRIPFPGSKGQWVAQRPKEDSGCGIIQNYVASGVTLAIRDNHGWGTEGRFDTHDPPVQVSHERGEGAWKQSCNRSKGVSFDSPSG